MFRLFRHTSAYDPIEPWTRITLGAGYVLEWELDSEVLKAIASGC